MADKFTPITPTIVAELAQSVLKKCSPLVVHVNSFSDQKLIYSYARHADATIVHNHRAPYLEPDVGSLAVQDCRYKDNHICKCL